MGLLSLLCKRRNRVVISVTRRDIEESRKMISDAEQGNPLCYWVFKHCPVALALSRKFPSKHVDVLREEIVISGRHYKNSEKVTSFISNFDKGQQVKPFKFVIDLGDFYV